MAAVNELLDKAAIYLGVAGKSLILDLGLERAPHAQVVVAAPENWACLRIATSIMAGSRSWLYWVSICSRVCVSHVSTFHHAKRIHRAFYIHRFCAYSILYLRMANSPRSK